MKILVTGAAGFIGSKLTERLIADGHEVIVLDVVEPDLPYRREIWDTAADCWYSDLREVTPTSLAEVALHGAAAVFHMAATVGGVGFLHCHDVEAYLDNARMSLNVLEAAERAGVGRVFFASSSCAYPVELQQHDTITLGDLPLGASILYEHDLEKGTPDGMYGREKLATLRLGEALRGAGRLDVRSGLINSGYGPGLRVEGERTKFPAAVVRKALECRRTGQPLEVWGDGTQRRGYIYIDDLVDKIVRLTLGDVYEGPVNLTTPETVSCDEVAKLALDLLDVDVPIVHVDGPTGPMARHCSNAMWERVYGPDPQPSFDVRFPQFVAWMEQVAGG